MGRFSDQVDWGTVALWVLLADAPSVAAVCLYLWVAGADRRWPVRRASDEHRPHGLVRADRRGVPAPSGRLDRAVPARRSLGQGLPPSAGHDGDGLQHSVLHVLTGLLALGDPPVGRRAGLWWFAVGFGLFYTALGLTGLVGHGYGLELQPFDHPFHLVAGIPGLVAAGLTSTRERTVVTDR